MSKYILALDQGTTSSRAILFTREGDIKQIAQKEFTQIYPQPGWVEHNANEIFDTQSWVMTECLQRAGVNASEVAAIGITNQRETTVVWDRKSGAPVHNAIVWQDRRTASICDEMKKRGLAETIREKTGLVIDAYFSGTKVKWILDNVPGARAKAERGELCFGTIDTWVIWNLTKGKEHVTDESNASRTMLFNIHTGDWDEELLKILDVPRSMLPRVAGSSEVVAETHPEFLGKAVPVSGIAGDQQAATFGNACLTEGMAKNTYGTGCFMLLNTGKQAHISKNNLLTTTGWNTPSGRYYCLEGSVFIAGAVVQWLRDGLGIIQSAPEVEQLALSVPDNGGVVLVPAFAGLGAPHWDQYARGTMVGVTRGTTKAHIARAALESIALQTLDIMDCMQKDAGINLAALRADGGATRNNLLMQFQADVLGVPVERPKVTETTALGAAYLAGLAVGFWKSEDEITAMWQLDRRFEPNMSAEVREKLVYNWKRAVERSKEWAED
ncbi:glycerol kinase [Oleidesulfovibrio alaskensis G20]|jgi:glycerol kinase|uniref:Glycerol kinase n=1 Tax=Oleidesulfovibrio alaskensis (strain ATCC BAA-1058 / DSM 17464 / G20) TaxID=207559 RepID=GLPK_OLEA2|nr:glycerol kinase GlpK [Oleidesulfovibrio alaskensis]Q316D5.1 RecName: Full=Glycerol kinase; AltName: Full=ATP:glycerol 3-phosphotransferase; AltName: Full=Glycerokinase; Short=GK [Oleidesulfovibrio alaskensis G20]ABB37211.1 glycerol kinase [Oleidesulfovibrio alaskensis G20]MBG0772603.1 glycerol kinase GlpK [Oleidesulfovibrio alaskensis]